jgi:hypothetical protein
MQLMEGEAAPTGMELDEAPDDEMINQARHKTRDTQLCVTRAADTATRRCDRRIAGKSSPVSSKQRASSDSSWCAQAVTPLCEACVLTQRCVCASVSQDSFDEFIQNTMQEVVGACVGSISLHAVVHCP